MANQLVLVLNFKGQYHQLIARRVRECNVYCEVRPFHTSVEEIKAMSPIGIILTGGPDSLYEEGAPRLDTELFELGIPVLGIGYGMQLMADAFGGRVSQTRRIAHGKAQMSYDRASKLLGNWPSGSAWMSDGAPVEALPAGFFAAASTPGCAVAAMEDAQRGLYGLQFHPELDKTENGTDMLRRFLYDLCGARGDWTMQDYAQACIEGLRRTIGDGRVLLALSGGVDSSVCAALLDKAVGEQLTCIFVDTGLMRKNEGDEVEAAFSNGKMHFIRVNAQERFLGKLRGVDEPESKRKIIGEEFIRVFEEEARRIGKVDFLAQGTIYPDVIESGFGDSAVIKSHHNVGGLPDKVDFKELVEPLRPLFKDEVRALGEVLGLAPYLVWRQPFPGPGLAIRVIGEVTFARLEILREADWIFREEIAAAGLNKTVGQYFAVITPMRSVGVTDDARTYDYTLALRAVTTTDFMTAEWARIPHEILDKASRRIVSEVKGINRIVYDITSKPPATIEWE